MNVVVDTSVWSLALRRNTPNDAIAIVNPANPAIKEFLNRDNCDGNLMLCCVSSNLRMIVENQ